MPVYKDADRNGKWYFQCRYTAGLDEMGNEIKKTKKSGRYDTKREAQAAERKFLNEQMESKSTEMTFNELCDLYSDYKRDRLKKTSFKAEQNKMKHIRKVLGNIAITKLTTKQYQVFMKSMEDTLSPLYRNKVLQLVRSMLQFSEKRHGVTTRVPFLFDDYKVKNKNTMKLDFWTIDEYQNFIRVVDDDIFKALFETLFFEGMRVGEANALTWRDVSFKDGTISISKTVDTKLRDEDGNYLVSEPKTQSSNRVIPMTKRVAESLKIAYNYWRKADGFNFDWKVFGGKISIPNTTIQKAKQKYLALANELLISEGKEPLKEIRIHGFRHSCACLLMNRMEGVPITVVAQWLGHASTKETLDTYSSFYPQDVDKLASKIDAFLETYEKD